jgi:membrane protein implicated in regulation of membrane protease activity
MAAAESITRWRDGSVTVKTFGVACGGALVGALIARAHPGLLPWLGRTALAVVAVVVAALLLGTLLLTIFAAPVAAIAPCFRRAPRRPASHEGRRERERLASGAA